MEKRVKKCVWGVSLQGLFLAPWSVSLGTRPVVPLSRGEGLSPHPMQKRAWSPQETGGPVSHTQRGQGGSQGRVQKVSVPGAAGKGRGGTLTQTSRDKSQKQNLPPDTL